MTGLSDPSVIDDLIVWRMNDPRYTKRDNQLKGLPMQRQWTIEARADFADADKNEAITEAVKRAAVHINATIALLADGQKPQVVAFSDDFFAGHTEINLLEDTIGKGMAEHADLQEGGVSEEMMQAMRDLRHDKNAEK